MKKIIGIILIVSPLLFIYGFLFIKEHVAVIAAIGVSAVIILGAWLVNS